MSEKTVFGGWLVIVSDLQSAKALTNKFKIYCLEKAVLTDHTCTDGGGNST